MKEANYSNGDYYHYTYDAVGNRKTQTTKIGATITTTGNWEWRMSEEDMSEYLAGGLRELNELYLR